MEWTIRLEVKTGRGEVESLDLTAISRPARMATAEEVGLSLAEAKALLARLQASMVRTQTAEHVASGRICPGCGTVLRVKDRRPRRLQTLFGTVEVEAPRLKPCPCRQGAAGQSGATVSPACELLRGARGTPEPERVQAELGARASFREAARILTAPLPVGTANHASVRNRTHAIGQRLEAEAPSRVGMDRPTPDEIVVAIDGADVRAAPGCQTRHFEVILGKVEDWFHLSMRVRRVEQVVRGLHALAPSCPLPVDCAHAEVERLRHLLWNGRRDEARAILGAVTAIAGTIGPLNGPGLEREAARLVELCAELRGHIGHTQGSGFARRLRATASGRQADLELAGGEPGQPAGRRPHEQAAADALVTSWRTPPASGPRRCSRRPPPWLTPPSCRVAPGLFHSLRDAVEPGGGRQPVPRGQRADVRRGAVAAAAAAQVEPPPPAPGDRVHRLGTAVEVGVPVAGEPKVRFSTSRSWAGFLAIKKCTG